MSQLLENPVIHLLALGAWLHLLQSLRDLQDFIELSYTFHGESIEVHVWQFHHNELLHRNIISFLTWLSVIDCSAQLDAHVLHSLTVLLEVVNTLNRLMA